jgi:hypothetical protein
MPLSNRVVKITWIAATSPQPAIITTGKIGLEEGVGMRFPLRFRLRFRSGLSCCWCSDCKHVKTTFKL